MAGLKPTTLDEMIRGELVLLRDASQQAITLEKIQTPLKTNLPMVDEIDEDHDYTELDGEIKAVRPQLNQLNSKKSQYKYPSKFGQQSGGSGYLTTG